MKENTFHSNKNIWIVTQSDSEGGSNFYLAWEIHSHFFHIDIWNLSYSEVPLATPTVPFLSETLVLFIYDQKKQTPLFLANFIFKKTVGSVHIVRKQFDRWFSHL